MHGRLDLPEHQTVFNAFGSIPVISISDMQRKPVPQARWMKTIYHGLPADLLAPSHAKPGYLAFLRSEEHTSELQSHSDLVCRLLLEKKKKNKKLQKIEKKKKEKIQKK